MAGVILRRLQALDQPIDLILVGLGFMGYGFLRRVRRLSGMRVPLVITRDVPRTMRRLTEAGLACAPAASPAAVAANVERNVLSVSSDCDLIGSLPYKIIVEMTGDVAYGAQIALTTFDHGKHLVTMNTEMHATIGSYLKRYADARGVQITDIQGDQPGSLAGLIDEARLYGLQPIMAGNIKGYLDRQATPDTVRPWAAATGLSLKQTTSFTDGTKLALEMGLVANYYGMRVLQTGMTGPRVGRIQEILEKFDWGEIPEPGCVDYVLGKSLASGVFVVCACDDEEQKPYLRYLKLGDGPQYLLHRPYHLCHLEAPLSVAKMALFDTVTINNSERPVTRVSAFAKRALQPGEALDGIGGYCCYGMVDNVDSPGLADAVPIGLIAGSTARRAIAPGTPVRRQDVDLPGNAATRIWEAADASA